MGLRMIPVDCDAVASQSTASPDSSGSSSVVASPAVTGIGALASSPSSSSRVAAACSVVMPPMSTPRTEVPAGTSPETATTAAAYPPTSTRAPTPSATAIHRPRWRVGAGGLSGGSVTRSMVSRSRSPGGQAIPRKVEPKYTRGRASLTASCTSVTAPMRMSWSPAGTT